MPALGFRNSIKIFMPFSFVVALSMALGVYLGPKLSAWGLTLLTVLP